LDMLRYSARLFTLLHSDLCRLSQRTESSILACLIWT
jgi:hypothetical protein